MRRVAEIVESLSREDERRMEPVNFPVIFSLLKKRRIVKNEKIEEHERIA